MLELKDILERAGTVLLDDALKPGGSDTSAILYQNPIREISVSVPADVPIALAKLDDEVKAGQHVAGYLSYEAGYAYGERHLRDQARKDWSAASGIPVLWFGVYDGFTRVTADEMSALGGQTGNGPYTHAPFAPPPPIARMHQDEYADTIASIRSLIHEGDLYQLNFTFRLDGLWEGHPADLYGQLRSRQPVAYGAFLNLGDVQILSASPEKFFSRDGDRITVRPMKGTAPRGETPALDRMYTEWLESDQKNRSENLMILDLLRNDLSRICTPASVVSKPIFTVEQYDTVYQMVSGVQGHLAPGTGYVDIFRSLFPSGSITGAPKIRAMRRIAELERDPRGIYCGAIGHVTPDDHASFNVAIRTLTLNKKKYVAGSGGGIVWESGAKEEYEEALLKTRYLSPSESKKRYEEVSVLETVYLCINKSINNSINNDIYEYRNIDRHIGRMIRSAKALGYSLDTSTLRARIDAAITEAAITKAATIQGSITSGSIARSGLTGPPGTYKLRLLLNARGILSAELTDLIEDEFTLPRRIGISKSRVHSRNPFLYHKTTFRPDYDRGKREAQERGLDDLVFVNEAGHLTETTICNIFLRIGDVWRTPPVDCGLLAGVGRALEMMSDRRPLEDHLTIQDLQSADEIVLVNSVRGRLPALLIDDVN